MPACMGCIATRLSSWESGQLCHSEAKASTRTILYHISVLIYMDRYQVTYAKRKQEDGLDWAGMLRLIQENEQ